MARGSSSQPAQRFRIGNVTAAVWKNDNYFSVTIQRSYKEGDDWKNADNLYPADLLNGAKVLERAEAWIAEQ